MITIFGEEKFRPCTRFGIQIPQYYVSSDGRVYSSITNKILKPGISGKNSSTGTCLTVAFTTDKKIMSDFPYMRSKSKKKDRIQFSCTVHRLVMEAWRPLDKYPPDSLRECWDYMPEQAKQWVKDTAIIDHINDNPLDNRVENLRWVTPIQNAYRRKVHEFK